MAETRVRLATEHGDIVLRFFPEVAPKHVENFLELTRRGFYDGAVNDSGPRTTRHYRSAHQAAASARSASRLSCALRFVGL